MNAISIIAANNKIVGHAPRELASVLTHFLNHSGVITVTVTNPKYRHCEIAGGLEIIANYKLSGKQNRFSFKSQEGLVGQTTTLSSNGLVSKMNSKPENKKRSYEVNFKLQAIQYAKENSKDAAARTFKVDQKRIREWCKQENDLQALKDEKGQKKKRLGGGGSRKTLMMPPE